MQNAKRYPCPLCLSEMVPADRKACDTCVEMFHVADEKADRADGVDATKRVPIGPTDV